MRLIASATRTLMSHGHSLSRTDDAHAMSDARLLVAVAVNGLLTVVQAVGGLLSGSLSLVADALHNLSDAGALLIAWSRAGSAASRPTGSRRSATGESSWSER